MTIKSTNTQHSVSTYYLQVETTTCHLKILNSTQLLLYISTESNKHTIINEGKQRFNCKLHLYVSRSPPHRHSHRAHPAAQTTQCADHRHSRRWNIQPKCSQPPISKGAAQKCRFSWCKPTETTVSEGMHIRHQGWPLWC